MGGTGTGGSSNGGAAGMGGSGGTAGMGGSGGCSTAADCNDGFNCTIDTCNAGMCEHVVGPNSGPTACPPGKLCQIDKGCVDVTICADDAVCIQKLGGDPCKSNIHCDLATSVCVFSPLDKDKDGQSPIVCGGADCDDSLAETYPGAIEKCDGKDNNCNGMPDENATCPGLSVCQAGACTCPPANTCGVDCIDKMTSNTHCGMCNNACTGASTCMNGQCVCPGGATTCNGACVDTKTDPLNCGGCNKTCASGYSCANSLCTCLGTPCGMSCVNTMSDPQHCGGCNMPCPMGAGCLNGACICPNNQTYCGGQCVDTMTNTTHCGGCNKPCNGICQNGACTPCTVSNLYLFADISGSMGDTVPMGGTKLDAMRTGINTFLTDPLSTNMGVGIGYHPVPSSSMGMVCFGTNTPCMTDMDCAMVPFGFCTSAAGTDSCLQSDYETPAVSLGLLPGNQMAMTNSLALQMPTGGSLPPPGYQGALQYAKNYAMMNASQKVAVVLLSDNFPRICNTVTDLPDDLLPIAQQYATGTPKVLTYVIGISDGVAPNPTQAQLNQVAAAGGTGTAWIANSSTAVSNALSAIRMQFKTCP